MSRLKILGLLEISLLILLASCEEGGESKKETGDSEDPSDYTWDTSTVVQVTLNTNSITVEPAVATVDGSKVTITSAGTYNISGTLSDGQVLVNTKDDGNVRIILDGIKIKCSSSAPIYVEKAKKVIIILKDGTTNSISDGTSYTQVDGEPDAAIFSNAYLSFSGEGSLSVVANFQDGISSDDGMIIDSGTITVKAADDGIRGKDYLIIRSGNITVTSTGDGLKSTNEEDPYLGYIKIINGNISVTTTSGDAIDAVSNLDISDGVYSLTTGGGASSVYTGTGTGGGNPGGGPGGGGSGSGGYSGTNSEKGLKGLISVNIVKGTFNINCADDAIHSNGSITISDGTLALASGDDGIHADVSMTIDGGTIDMTKSYEGFESASITINGGTISIVSTDDGFNATMGSATESNDGSFLNINSGNIVVNSSTGDAIDSNGNVTMKGGTVIAHGPSSSPEVGIDVNGTFYVSGGILVATGPNSGNMIESISATSSQYAVKTTITSTLASSSLFHIEDSGGNDIITYKPVRTIYYIVVSKTELSAGETYSIYTGGTSTGTNVNGVYKGGTYSGGTFKKSFTISGELTNVSF
jgi:hypothetical protein